MLGDLELERIRSLLTGSWGRSLSLRESTESTMDDAFEAASGGAPDGHVELADRQTRGRGAHGRQWVSPSGSDLYFSVVTRPSVDLSAVALVTLAAGLGIREAVAELVPNKRVQVKWPNDIWIERRKCAGILVESRSVGARIDPLIIGVGLNVNREHWPPELTGIATSLRAEREGEPPLDRASVLSSALSCMERRFDAFTKDGPSVVVDALRPHLALLEEPVRWEDGEGVFEGIGFDGAARVRTDTGTVSLHAAHLEAIPR
jgi:BirA family biotin operon repressor/biotin-[acetyl-CoA-carboxylase] ligase